MAANDQDRLLDHSYDGIQEYDNPMPRWWVLTFWATIVFSLLYVVNVPGVGNGDGRIADYNADVARATEMRAKMEPAGAVTAASLDSMAKDPSVVASGKQLFATYCAACHRPDGGGQIGPNLTDDSWIHGGTLQEIHHIITAGVLAKGMPEWGKVLKPDQVNAVSVYVKSLLGTNPPNPKPAEGTKVDP